jgi:hypothetical protein
MLAIVLCLLDTLNLSLTLYSVTFEFLPNLQESMSQYS